VRLRPPHGGNHQELPRKIYVTPPGSIVPNKTDLLMSQRIRDLIAELRGEFDYIVMDASPLLAVVDALTLATIVDKILLIRRVGPRPAR
jgi:Mrp family chromosome partitioning ATPase